MKVSSSNQMMKAVALPDKTNCKVVEIPKPIPNSGEVLIKVEYSGKSAFVFFYHVHMCVQCEVLVIWLLHLSLHCIHLLALATHMY